jgi:hypothetical protein
MDGYLFNRLVDMHLIYMAMKMALVRELSTSTRKRSQIDAIETIKQLPQLIVSLEKLEHLSLFLSTGEERGLSQHLMLSISWTVLTRIWMSATQLNVTQMAIWKILHGKLLYPYSLQPVQGLKPADCSAHDTSCQWFVQQCAEPFFLLSVLFSNQAGFGRESLINFHNHHEWAENSPRGILQSRHKQQFSINVWAGIVGDYLVGPYILPCQLTGKHYRDVLLNDCANY